MEQQELIDRIKRLPHEQLAEVAEFVEALTQERPHDRRYLYQALSEYATQHAATTADLDPAFEAIATDHLLNQDSEL